MKRVLFSFRLPKGTPPTVAVVCLRLGFTPDEVDEAYGVVLIDDEDDTYVVRVDERAAARVDAKWRSPSDGSFSDPRIEPFGPPENDPDRS